MYIDLDHRLAFVHIPKTAGEQIYRILYKVFQSGMRPQTRGANGMRWQDSASVSFWGQDKLRGLDATHLHQGILYDYVGRTLYESCVSFAVVRDPYDRFYSAFGDIPSKVAYSRKMGNDDPFWVGRGYSEYGNPKGPGVTPEARAAMFERFCDIVEAEGIVDDAVTKHNIHLVPQHKFVYAHEGNGVGSTGTARANVTVVVRFDTLGTLYEQLEAAYIARWGAYGMRGVGPVKAGKVGKVGKVEKVGKVGKGTVKDTVKGTVKDTVKDTMVVRRARRAPHSSRRPRSSRPAVFPSSPGTLTTETTKASGGTRRRLRRRPRPRPARAPGREPIRQGPPHAYLRALLRHTFTPASVANVSHRHRLFSERAKRLVERLYAEDFERFGFARC